MTFSESLDSMLQADPDGTATGRRRGKPRGGRRGGFREWRGARPFVAGLLLILGGIELLALILSGLLLSGAIKMVIYIGIGGVFGILVAALMIVAGVALWMNPAHRVFYSIAGLVLGLISFPATNLGGFFIGMLLAMIGGAFGFAWTRDEPEAARSDSALDDPARDESGPRATFTPKADIAETIADGFPAIRDDAEPSPSDSPGGPGGPGGNPGAGPGQKLLAIAALPAVLAAGIVGASGTARQGAAPQGSSGCILGIFCTSDTPSPSPSATPSPSSSGGLGGLLPSGLLPSGSADPSASPSPSGTAIPTDTKKTAAPSGVVAPTATSVLTTGSAVLTNFNFAGVTSIPRSGGGTEQVMEFTADTASLTKNVHVTVNQDGSVTNSDAGSFIYTDGMKLYTTKMCGQVEGITPNLCFTPTTISAIFLKFANVLAKATPITMLNASITNPLVSSGHLVVTPTKMGVMWGTR